jgi:hypothetical protein
MQITAQVQLAKGQSFAYTPDQAGAQLKAALGADAASTAQVTILTVDPPPPAPMVITTLVALDHDDTFSWSVDGAAMQALVSLGGDWSHHASTLTVQSGQEGHAGVPLVGPPVSLGTT